MNGTPFRMALVAVLLVLSACGDAEPSKLTFADVAGQLAKGDADAFKGYVSGLDNKIVKWTGTVTEARKWHEDDYVPAAAVLVDADDKPGPDLYVKISVDDLERAAKGAKVTVTGKLSGASVDQGRLLIVLDGAKVQ